jgi:type IV secretion system protein VirB10
MTRFRLASACLAVASAALLPAQPETPRASSSSSEQTAEAAADNPAVKSYTVATGTRVPLSLINSVSTKHAAEGDRVYLESVFPVMVDGRMVIPPGSYIAGTVTQVKQAGRVKGRAELFIRFDSLTLPNGVTRDFRARIGSLDGRATEELDRSEGKVKGESDKGGDARTIGEAAAGGSTIGAIAGSVAGRPGMGVGIGAAAGAAAGLVGVLAGRGPDAVLAKGTTLEMVLDRPISYTQDELDFGPASARRPASPDASGPLPAKKHQSLPLPGGRSPAGRMPF